MNIFIKYLIIINNLYLLNAVNLLVSFTYDIHVNLILNDHHLTFESECCLHYYKYQIIWNYLLCGIVYYYWQGHLSVKYIWYAAGYFLAIGFSIAKSKQPSKIIKLSISSSLPHLISVSNTNFMRSWSDVDKKREVNVSQTGFLIQPGSFFSPSLFKLYTLLWYNVCHAGCPCDSLICSSSVCGWRSSLVCCSCLSALRESPLPLLSLGALLPFGHANGAHPQSRYAAENQFGLLELACLSEEKAHRQIAQALRPGTY